MIVSYFGPDNRVEYLVNKGMGQEKRRRYSGGEKEGPKILALDFLTLCPPMVDRQFVFLVNFSSFIYQFEVESWPHLSQW